MMLFYRVWALAFSLFWCPVSATASCADLALVLAVDSSGSIRNDEFAMQQFGYGAAFQSQGVKRALAAAGVVDVAVIYWADSGYSLQVIPWHRLISAHDADVFGAIIMATPRDVTGDTDIGKGVNAAINMIADPNNCSNRAIINVSGDGIQSISAQRRLEITLADARKRAANLGIVINGLAIEDEVPKLAQYYHDNVISGPGSFVMNIQDFTTFATAIEEKLKKEINPVVLSSLESQPWR